MNQWTIRAWSQAWKCIYLELRDIEVRDDTGKMCAPVRCVAILLSCLFWQSGAFVLNGAIRQYGHNCQPPTTATTGDVSSLLHHRENTFTSIFACISEYDVALTPFSLQWVQIYIIPSSVLRMKRKIKNVQRQQDCKKKKTEWLAYCTSSDSNSVSKNLCLCTAK